MRDPNSPKGSVRWDGFGAGPSEKSAFKILTVDDNEALRYSLVRCLRDAGYHLMEATSGEEALALAAQQYVRRALDKTPVNGKHCTLAPRGQTASPEGASSKERQLAISVSTKASQLYKLQNQPQLRR